MTDILILLAQRKSGIENDADICRLLRGAQCTLNLRQLTVRTSLENMRLSLVFELLLIFVLLAFAASRVIDSRGQQSIKRIRRPNRIKNSHKNRQNNENKYCSCSAKLCNCCREFNIPVVALQGPGCASLQYLKGDRLAISMSFGERVLTNTTISGKKPKPVCMPLPGGVSKFCGRVYNIGREAEDFKACLGLELRSLEDIEASLRISCFRFGTQGLRVEPAQPLPAVEEEEEDEDDDDDDDDDDDFDFDAVDDDDDFDLDDDDDDDDENEADNDVDSADYGTFSVFDDDFIDDFFDSDTGIKKKPVKKVVQSTTKAPLRKVSRKPVRVPLKTTSRPLRRKVTKPKLRPSSTTELVQVTKSTITTSTQPEISTEAANESIWIISNSTGNIVSSSHDSIAAVTAMLQNTPTVEIPQEKPANIKLSEITPVPSVTYVSDEPLPKPVDISAPVEVMGGSVTTDVTYQPTSSISQETITQNALVEQVTEIHKPEATTVTEKHDSTETNENYEEDKEDEPVENLIIKNEDDDSDDDDDNDSEDSETDPMSSVVEDVLDDEDESDEKHTGNKKHIKKTVDKKKTNVKKESKDVLGDIVDGVVETITGEDSEESPTQNVTDESVKDEDDDDYLDDEEFDDDSDDDSEEEESRKAKKYRSQSIKRRNRQSKDMRVQRLH